MDIKVKNNDKIKVHYTGKFEDGVVFDSSRKNDTPLEFKVGTDSLIKGFADAVIGMIVGEKKQVTITPDKAYGNHNSELVKDIDKKFMPKDLEPKVGMQLKIGENEQSAIVTITKVSDEKVTIDGNHPLSGKILIFEIELISIA